MRRRSLLLVAVAPVSVLLLGVVPAHAKLLDACPVLAQEELETIFEQPFRTGVTLQGDYCAFTKPAGAQVPDIVVSVLVNRSKTVRAAEKEFDEAETTTRELAVNVRNVRNVGEEAFSTYFTGIDQLTVRVGKVVGVFRVDEPESDSTFPEQIIAVGQAAAPRLRNLSRAG